MEYNLYKFVLQNKQHADSLNFTHNFLLFSQGKNEMTGYVGNRTTLLP